ncbi:MAG: thioredoxin family protein [Marinirhabdus sp.]
MKQLCTALLLFTFALSYGQGTATSKLKWLTNLEEAQNIAAKKNMPILVYFTGSDWCAPCKLLKEDFFESKKFEERSKNFVLVLIDYPRRKDLITQEQFAYNKKVIAKYNKQSTFPKIVMLNTQGDEVARISSYSYSLRDTSRYFAFLDTAI